MFCQKYWVIENLFGGKKCNERTNLIMSCPRAGIIKQEIQRDAFIYKFDQLNRKFKEMHLFISLTNWVQDDLNCLDY